ncbi:MAG: threonine-phosphate decarboxylase CobD [Candidatus Omnitrophota bacterium]|nr:threonine-phosphate decarboxylase CobD [Candidatus Omnitrophota bacterium]
MINKFHGGNIWQYPKSSRSDIVDFSVNINPLGISKKIKRIIVSNIDKIGYYPDPESKYLKDSLAKFHGLSSHNFLIGNGSIELIHLIPRALKTKVVLIPIPSFSEYEFAAKAFNAKCIFVKSSDKDNFKIDVSKVIRLIPKAGLLFLCNPNNPTGSALTRQDIFSLLKVCKKYKAALMIDEVFIDFVPGKNKMSMLSESLKNKNLLVLRSLTKLFALPGLRIGYLVGHKDTINKLSRHTYPWNVNTLAQVVAEKIIEDKRYIARTRNVILKERAYLYDNLNNVKGIKVYPSDTNFFLCKLKNGRIKNAAELSKKLIGQGVLIRNCCNFRGLNDRFFRIAVKKRKANIKLISALTTLLE